jgi:hypothetical protein
MIAQKLLVLRTSNKASSSSNNTSSAFLLKNLHLPQHHRLSARPKAFSLASIFPLHGQLSRLILAARPAQQLISTLSSLQQ